MRAACLGSVFFSVFFWISLLYHFVNYLYVSSSPGKQMAMELLEKYSSPGLSISPFDQKKRHIESESGGLESGALVIEVRNTNYKGGGRGRNNCVLFLKNSLMPF